MADGEGLRRGGWWSPKGGRRRDPHIPAMQLQAPAGPGWGARPMGMLSPNPYRIVSSETSINEGICPPWGRGLLGRQRWA